FLSSLPAMRKERSRKALFLVKWHENSAVILASSSTQSPTIQSSVSSGPSLSATCLGAGPGSGLSPSGACDRATDQPATSPVANKPSAANHCRFMGRLLGGDGRI